MRKVLIAAISLGLILMLGAARAQAIEKIKPDPAAVALLNEFLTALSIPDDEKRLKAVLPLVHKSLIAKNGDLDRNVKDFSYRKACENVRFYQQPASIYEVHKGNVFTIGFKETAEQGRNDKYFINKKAGVAGRPAPLHVFFPSSGGPPKITNMGSL
ncbi:MAG: hypothetical protein RDV48_23800 [Candidatus Eremiobacteraeota bacterium]|nr:hypothetical protein [Candidatus Eremiobacteraeota bacterium]